MAKVSKEENALLFKRLRALQPGEKLELLVVSDTLIYRHKSIATVELVLNPTVRGEYKITGELSESVMERRQENTVFANLHHFENRFVLVEKSKDEVFLSNLYE